MAESAQHWASCHTARHLSGPMSKPEVTISGRSIPCSIACSQSSLMAQQRRMESACECMDSLGCSAKFDTAWGGQACQGGLSGSLPGCVSFCHSGQGRSGAGSFLPCRACESCTISCVALHHLARTPARLEYGRDNTTHCERLIGSCSQVCRDRARRAHTFCQSDPV